MGARLRFGIFCRNPFIINSKSQSCERVIVTFTYMRKSGVSALILAFCFLSSTDITGQEEESETSKAAEYQYHVCVNVILKKEIQIKSIARQRTFPNVHV